MATSTQAQTRPPRPIRKRSRRQPWTWAVFGLAFLAPVALGLMLAALVVLRSRPTGPELPALVTPIAAIETLPATMTLLPLEPTLAVTQTAARAPTEAVLPPVTAPVLETAVVVPTTGGATQPATTTALPPSQTAPASAATLNAAVTATPVPATSTAVPPTATSPAQPTASSGPWSAQNVSLHALPVPGSAASSTTILAELVNATGSAQVIQSVRLTIEFDSGPPQTIDDDVYYPLRDQDSFPIPADGRMPVEVTIFDPIGPIRTMTWQVQSAEAGPDNQPRQDLDFRDVSVSDRQNQYCVQYSVRNNGQPLISGAAVSLAVFDAQGRMLGLNSIYEAPDFALGNGLYRKVVCAFPYAGEPSQHRLYFWAR